jgi:peptide/nickel transport system substrate-binding protein
MTEIDFGPSGSTDPADPAAGTGPDQGPGHDGGYSRRAFLRSTALAAVGGAIVAACGGGDGDSSATDTTEVAGNSTSSTAVAETGAGTETGGYTSAPEFDGLAPAAERLPTNPRVVPVLAGIGAYGGVWNRVQAEGGSPWGPVKLLEENALRWELADGELQIVPNTLESWENNADATEFTWYMREGLKWSDGEPFTTADVQFWYDHYFERRMMGVFDFLFGADGESPMQLEVIDDYTYKTTFADPNPLLSLFVAKQGVGLLGGPTMAAPAHYLSRFVEGHPNEDSAAIAAALEETGLTSWEELHGQADNPFSQAPITFFAQNPDLPVLSMYVMQQDITADPFVMRRNPYYHCVDANGQQLPYIDEVVHAQFQDTEVFNLQIAQGKVDMQERYSSISDFTFYKENESSGDYSVKLWKSARTWSLFPNICHDDEGIRALFDNADFRQAMSIAINRQEINSLIYEGLLTPRQASPVSGSPNYDDAWANKWTDYDPEGAVALLEGVGLTREGDGFFRRPDGSALQLKITHHFDTGSSQSDEVGLIVRYLNEVGLDVSAEGISQDLERERIEANQTDIVYFWCDRSSVIEADPGRYTGEIADGPWAVPYVRFLNDNEGVKLEPPADHPIRRIQSLWKQAQVTGDEATRNGLVSEMLSVHADNPYIIGTVGEDPKPVIVSNRMRNVVESTIQDDSVRDISHTNPMTYYISA